MKGRPDALSAYDDLLARTPRTDPWSHRPGEPPTYRPQYDLLAQLLQVPVRAGAISESGRFAKAIDAWLAHELRRTGFGADEVWPRATRPRVLPREVAVLLDRLPARLATDVRALLERMPAVGPADAKILGRAYEKQVDVCIARWERGPELIISTKGQVSSFAKNLPNRFEEAYGDAANLRARYPLAAVGFFFLQRSTILTREPEAFERTVDMVRKLRDRDAGSGYTATGLLLVGWKDPAGPTTPVEVREQDVPADVAPPQFFTAMVRHVLAITPVVHHVAVRELVERRDLPVAEADAPDE